MRRRLLITVIALVALGAIGLTLRSGTTGSQALWDLSRGGTWLLPLVAVAAVIDSVNPCAFSVLLLTVAFLLSIGRLRSDLLRIGGWYIAGLGTVYLLIGLGLLQALHLFDTPHFMGRLGAALLIGLGFLEIANAVWPSFPVKLRIPHAAHGRMSTLMAKASAPAAFLLGALVGLCEFPCTGGPYLMVIGLLHDSRTYLQGVGYLVLYNAIFILPLVLMLALASNAAVVERVQAWQRSERHALRIGIGIAMIALGALTLLL